MSTPDSTESESSSPTSLDAADGWVANTLQRLADVGNRLPDPMTFFVLLAGGVVAISAIFAGTSVEMATSGGETETHTVVSLLTADGIRWMFMHAIDNFVGFAPLGPVLVVMLGIGIAERSGYITIGLRMLVESVPTQWITATLVFAGAMSSMAADA